ncbi:hypothetical protein PTKIN_Ptkin03bG0074100 [Pterospermum kingtungense]
MDRYTVERKMLEYARICIEPKVGKEIPRFIEVVRKNGSVACIEVDVPWMPIRCDKCQFFGHSAKFVRRRFRL